MSAPKLVTLGLETCYSLTHVRLSPDEGPLVHVNLLNANIDDVSLEHFHLHPRVEDANIDDDVQDD